MIDQTGAMATRIIVLIFCMGAAMTVRGEEEIPSDVPVLTPEQLENYRFTPDPDEAPPVIEDLSVGQRFILDAQRREIKELIARRLGMMDLKGDKRDLPVIQQVIDRDILRDDEVKEWQSLGVIFGDILATELNLHWVSYEDDLGVSKALQWKDTLNVVFPITVFSKRIQFGQQIDVQQLYEKIRKDVADFSDLEAGMRIKT